MARRRRPRKDQVVRAPVEFDVNRDGEVIVLLVENWQTPDGLVVPPALRPWMCGIEFIPFVSKLDKKKRLVSYFTSAGSIVWWSERVQIPRTL